MNRLLNLPTLRIDPSRPLSMTYGGNTVTGCEGDTIASALYAHGIRIFSRSLKYHRPRGLYSLDGECANTMLEVNGQPNVQAEVVPAMNGMTICPQNVKGAPEHDRMAFMDKLGWAMPAGFFYSMFHRPAFIWPLAAENIRKAAGLGRLRPDFRLSGHFDEIYPNADVCVIGGGPAGMQAALAAAESGMRVILLERRPWLGGSFEYRPRTDDKGVPLYQRARELEARIARTPSIRVFTRTPATGVEDRVRVIAIQHGCPEDAFCERYVEITARTLVVATGCIERPLLFAHNDRPGVMQVACAHRLARTWGILPGKHAVFSVGHDLGLEAAIDLHDLGLSIDMVADARVQGQDPALVAALNQRGITFRSGWLVGRAVGTKQVRGALMMDTAGNAQTEVSCDTLIASAGLTPLTGPLTLAGARVAYDPHSGFFLPQDLPAGIFAAGSLLGLNDPQSLEASGWLTGLRTAAACGKDLDDEISAVASRLASLPGPPPGNTMVCAPVEPQKMFICFDEDATVKNVDQAMAKGFDQPELIKRFTATGTGPGQGGISGHNLPLVVAATGQSPLAQPRPTTVRSPLSPMLVAAVAGSAQDPVKRSPLGRAGEATDGSIDDQVHTVRTAVGMQDASSLGKFRLFGPDALKVLQRVYVGDMSALEIGKATYAVMCNDDGCVVDQGRVVKRAENDYYLTTDPARAAMTAQWLRFHTRFDGWSFHLVDLTDAFGVIHLAGPHAQEVLETLIDADLSDHGFPLDTYGEFNGCGSVPVSVLRDRLFGERAFALHVPASWMPEVWSQIRDTGRPLGIGHFEWAAFERLQVEAGHLCLATECEQRVTLNDLGLGALWHRDKRDARTVGAAALRQTENQPDRLKRIGFKMPDHDPRPPRTGSVIVDEKIRGYVCTAFFSRTVKASIGTALVVAPLAVPSGRLRIFEDGCRGVLREATVAPLPFYPMARINEDGFVK